MREGSKKSGRCTYAHRPSLDKKGGFRRIISRVPARYTGSVRSARSVCLIRGNILEEISLAGRGPNDVFFFRNLLLSRRCGPLRAHRTRPRSEKRLTAHARLCRAQPFFFPAYVPAGSILDPMLPQTGGNIPATGVPASSQQVETGLGTGSPETGLTGQRLAGVHR